MTVASRYAKSHELDCVTLDGDTVNRRGALTGGFHDALRSRMGAQAKLAAQQVLAASLGAEQATLQAETLAADQVRARTRARWACGWSLCARGLLATPVAHCPRVRVRACAECASLSALRAGAGGRSPAAPSPHRLDRRRRAHFAARRRSRGCSASCNASRPCTRAPRTPSSRRRST
jgi:structural maintenance of chromosome 3 (chondroitin sulfate proteoglycan 6)